jgi:hypothetical protein
MRGAKAREAVEAVAPPDEARRSAPAPAAVTRASAMTAEGRQQVAIMRTAVDEVLGAVPFELPIQLSYCEAVMERLKVRLPNAGIDVYHRYVDLVVRVDQGNARYELVLPIPAG